MRKRPLLVVGALLAVLWAYCARRNDSALKSEAGQARTDVSPRADGAPTRVTLAPWQLQYFEEKNTLTLTAEMGSDRQGAYFIVYVPTPNWWLRKMPEWSRHRREEILAEIIRLTKNERIKWVDED